MWKGLLLQGYLSLLFAVSSVQCWMRCHLPWLAPAKWSELTYYHATFAPSIVLQQQELLLMNPVARVEKEQLQRTNARLLNVQLEMRGVKDKSLFHVKTLKLLSQNYNCYVEQQCLDARFIDYYFSVLDPDPKILEMFQSQTERFWLVLLTDKMQVIQVPLVNKRVVFLRENKVALQHLHRRDFQVIA